MEENSIEKDEEILNNIKAFMQESINKGCHKFIYNDLGYDEKCVDVINAIEHILSEYKRVQKENEELKNDYENLNNSVVVKNHCIKNSIPVQKVKDKIRKNEEIIDISNNGDLIHELLQKNKVYEELLESEK